MSLDFETAKTWSNERLLREYESRDELLHSLGGWLYTSIVRDEMSSLDEIAITRTGVALFHWRDQHIVPSSWTDEHGVTHEWLPHPHCYKPGRRADDPIKHTTCLLCVVLP